jgi:hypothetical protein
MRWLDRLWLILVALSFLLLMATWIALYAERFGWPVVLWILFVITYALVRGETVTETLQSASSSIDREKASNASSSSMT